MTIKFKDLAREELERFEAILTPQASDEAEEYLSTETACRLEIECPNVTRLVHACLLADMAESRVSTLH